MWEALGPGLLGLCPKRALRLGFTDMFRFSPTKVTTLILWSMLHFACKVLGPVYTVIIALISGPS